MKTLLGNPSKLFKIKMTKINTNVEILEDFITPIKSLIDTYLHKPRCAEKNIRNISLIEAKILPQKKILSNGTSLILRSNLNKNAENKDK